MGRQGPCACVWVDWVLFSVYLKTGKVWLSLCILGSEPCVWVDRGGVVVYG